MRQKNSSSRWIMILWEIRETQIPVFGIKNTYSTVHCGVTSSWQVRAGFVPNTANSAQITASKGKGKEIPLQALRVPGG
jgi:hypothetical protein